MGIKRVLLERARSARRTVTMALSHRGVRVYTICDDDAGRLWRYGRMVIHTWTGDGETGRGYAESANFLLSWHFRPEWIGGAEVSVGGGDSDCDLTVNLGLFGASVWATYESLPRGLCERILPGRDVRLPSQQVVRMTEEVHTGLRFHSGAIWWTFWAKAHSWSATDPWWQRLTWNPADSLFGREQMQTEVLRVERDVPIPMPEGLYYGDVTLKRNTWRRPRWPFPTVLYLGNVNVAAPPRFPGKGESGYDLDDDMTFSLSCPARTVADVVGAYVRSVLRDRERRGGSIAWQPSAG